MNFVIISFDDLKYDALTCHGNKIINTNIFDSFAKQSICFHNFRLSSPIPRENINYIIKTLDNISVEREMIFFDDYNQTTICNDFISDNVTNKNDYIIWRHCNNASDILFADYQSYVLYIQEKARSLIDYLDENDYINNQTIIILMGMAGHPRIRRTKIFPGERTLYDDLLHVPLMIFHPEFKARDVHNSITLEVLANSLKYWIDPHFFSDETFFDLLQEGQSICDKRWDTYSKYNNCFGLRGPMFQYYCNVNKDNVVIDQELYDLNNDYLMENDLVIHAHNLSPMIVDLINTYRKRVIKRFCK